MGAPDGADVFLYSIMGIFKPAMLVYQEGNPQLPTRNRYPSPHHLQAAAAQMKLDQAKTTSSAACSVSSLCDLASSKALSGKFLPVGKIHSGSK